MLPQPGPLSSSGPSYPGEIVYAHVSQPIKVSPMINREGTPKCGRNILAHPGSSPVPPFRRQPPGTAGPSPTLPPQDFTVSPAGPADHSPGSLDLQLGASPRGLQTPSAAAPSYSSSSSPRRPSVSRSSSLLSLCCVRSPKDS